MFWAKQSGNNHEMSTLTFAAWSIGLWIWQISLLRKQKWIFFSTKWLHFCLQSSMHFLLRRLNFYSWSTSNNPFFWMHYENANEILKWHQLSKPIHANLLLQQTHWSHYEEIAANATFFEWEADWNCQHCSNNFISFFVTAGAKSKLKLIKCKLCEN